jgi:Ca2+-binding EF-hand superfamily protein
MLSGINQSSQMASRLFSKLDTKQQGYIEKTDLASAFSQIASDSQSSTNVDDVFSALDSNSDGKVTKDEFSSVLTQLQEQMDSQRMQKAGGHGGPQGAGGPPPPPPKDDAGFTKDELTSQINSADSSDTQRTDLMTKIVENFAAADTNSDGKVSFTEAMAYDQSSQTKSSSSSSSSTSDSSSNTSTNNSEAQVMMKIMQLIHAYGGGNDQDKSSFASQLSASA